MGVQGVSAAPQVAQMQAQAIVKQAASQLVSANTVQSAAQESAETPQQTQLEAAAGNSQAKIKLAQEQGGQVAQVAAARAGQGRNVSTVA